MDSPETRLGRAARLLICPCGDTGYQPELVGWLSLINGNTAHPPQPPKCFCGRFDMELVNL